MPRPCYKRAVFTIRFLIASACFIVLGLAIYGIGHLAGCDTDQRPHLRAEMIDGTRWLTHERGFRLVAPGPGLVADRATAERFESLAMSCDTYLGPRAVLTVCVLDEPIASRADLVRQLDGARRGAARAAEQVARQQPGYLTSGLEGLVAGTVTTLADDVHWADGRGDGYLHLTSQGIHIQIKAFTIDGGLAVLLATGAGLDGVVASFARS